MSDKKTAPDAAQEPLETPVQEPLETPAPNAGNATVAYVLQQLEAIRQDNAHIHKALECLECLAAMYNGENAGNDLDQAKVAAIADVVKCRETTNQKLLDFYMRLYEDCKPATRALDIDGAYDLVTLINSNTTAGFGDSDANAILLDALKKRL